LDATSSNTGIQSALALVAEIAYTENRDRWLLDILASSRAKEFPSAVAALSGAVGASDAGNYSMARSEAMRAKRLFESVGSSAGLLRSKFENIYALHLSHEGALCLNAIAAVTNIDEYSWLRVQFHIEQAICQGLMGNLGEAQAVLNQAIADAQSSRYPSLYLRAVGNAAEMESGSGNMNSAWDRASSGLAFFWSTPVRPMQGYNLYVRLCSMAQEERHPYLEVAIWRQALAMIDTDEDYLLRAMAHSMTASAALDAQMQNLASHEFNEADRLFLAAPQTRATANDRIEAGATLAAVEARAGRLTEALGLIQSLRPGMAQLSNNYVAIQFYGALGEVERRLGNVSEAEQSLRSAVALSELSLESLKSEMDRVAWSQLTAATYSNLVQLRLHAGDATGALELWEWYRGAALRAGAKNDVLSATTKYGRMKDRLQPAALAEGPALPSLREVSHALPGMENQTVISYAVFSDELVLWIFDNRGIESKLLKKPSREVDALVSRFVDLCSDPRSDLDDVENASRTIYEMLIAPIESKLSPQRTLIIETEKSLDRLPLNLLMDSRGRYLADLVPVVVSLGLYYNIPRRPAAAISPRSAALIVGVGLPSDSMVGHFSLVAEAEREAEDITRNFETARLLKGGQATLSRVSQELRKAEVFHFAGHAVASAGESGLVLSDRVLSADLLENSAMQGLRLVVLSGCDTRRGSSGRNDDYDSLVRMFVRKGVPDVIASRWKVDSSATALFMEKFYSILISGRSVPESLREAQISLRDRPETSHPYYWGAFTAFAAN
jgi:CHAT domain-containing protein